MFKSGPGDGTCRPRPGCRGVHCSRARGSCGESTETGGGGNSWIRAPVPLAFPRHRPPLAPQPGSSLTTGRKPQSLKFPLRCWRLEPACSGKPNPPRRETVQGRVGRSSWTSQDGQGQGVQSRASSGLAEPSPPSKPPGRCPPSPSLIRAGGARCILGPRTGGRERGRAGHLALNIPLPGLEPPGTFGTHPTSSLSRTRESQ